MPFLRDARTLKYVTGRKVIVVLMLIALWTLLLPMAVTAHPMGNFSINRYSRLAIDQHQVEILHVIDMAEIPTHAARVAMDGNGDGEIDPTERAAFATTMQRTISQNLYLESNGKAVDLAFLELQTEFNAGQAGLPTLRIESTWRGELDAMVTPMRLAYRDDTYADRIGWREVIVVPGENIITLESSVPMVDESNQLRNFPIGELQGPLDVSSAEFMFSVGNAAPLWTAAATTNSQSVEHTAFGFAPNILSNADSRFADLINQKDLGWLAVVLALAAAFGWGALHALSPGHGKSIAGAYLVGTRGTVRHAFFLGVTTTVAHTTGVFLMGLVALAASQFIVTEQLFPWLSATSGLLVVLIGLSMVRQRFGRNPSFFKVMGRKPRHHHHQHDHGHSYVENHTHVHGHTHDHSHAHELHHHHHHPSDGHEHGHTHMPPGADGSPVTWRSLLALGISGGIIPCPSALVLMLGAVAVDRIAFGLMLIVIFSVGLAGVLTAIGVMVVHSGRLLNRIPRSGTIVQWLPVASATFITVVGIGITVRAIGETGLPLPW